MRKFLTLLIYINGAYGCILDYFLIQLLSGQCQCRISWCVSISECLCIMALLCSANLCTGGSYNMRCFFDPSRLWSFLFLKGFENGTMLYSASFWVDNKWLNRSYKFVLIYPQVGRMLHVIILVILASSVYLS